MPPAVTQSYKKVLNFAATSRVAATQVNHSLVSGVDSTAQGQTSATDPNVVTGSKIYRIEIQYAVQNLVAVSAFIHASVQFKRSGQASISPQTVGGNPQRNQVLHQDLFSIGKEQNVNRKYIVKVPKQFQRIREGDIWSFSYIPDQIVTDVCQVIFKTYR